MLHSSEAEDGRERRLGVAMKWPVGSYVEHCLDMRKTLVQYRCTYVPYLGKHLYSGPTLVITCLGFFVVCNTHTKSTMLLP